MATLTNVGDRVEGERLYIEARNIDKAKQPVNRTGRHKAQTAIAEDNWKAVCVIERPMRAKRLSQESELERKP